MCRAALSTLPALTRYILTAAGQGRRCGWSCPSTEGGAQAHRWPQLAESATIAQAGGGRPAPDTSAHGKDRRVQSCPLYTGGWAGPGWGGAADGVRETLSPEGGFSADARPLHRPTWLSHVGIPKYGGVHIHVGWKHPITGEGNCLLQ